MLTHTKINASEVRRFRVEPCRRNDIKEFIETHHYSKSINGCMTDYCFRLMRSGEMIGAAFFGRMAMANQYRRFAESESEVLELRRLCCVDETPKNTESYFIGSMLRWLRRQTETRIVVSYADKEHGHTGIIYKASNFQCWGDKPGARVIYWNGKKYHDKAIRTKYKGELKPFAKRLKDALDKGDAFYMTTAGKVTYVYRLRSEASC